MFSPAVGTSLPRYSAFGANIPRYAIRCTSSFFTNAARRLGRATGVSATSLTPLFLFPWGDSGCGAPAPVLFPADLRGLFEVAENVRMERASACGIAEEDRCSELGCDRGRASGDVRCRLHSSRLGESPREELALPQEPSVSEVSPTAEEPPTEPKRPTECWSFNAALAVLPLWFVNAQEFERGPQAVHHGPVARPIRAIYIDR